MLLYFYSSFFTGDIVYEDSRISAPFVFSAVLFLISFLALDDGGYIWLVFMAIGLVIALLGVVLAVKG